MSEIIRPGSVWLTGPTQLADAIDVCAVPEHGLYFTTAGANALFRSADGGKTWANWFAGSPSLSFDARTCIAWSPDLGVLVALGSDTNALWSDDPTDTGAGAPHWSITTTGLPGDAGWEKCLWVSELALFIAVGRAGARSYVAYSPDGATWTSELVGAPAAGPRNVAWSPDLTLLVAIGGSGTDTPILTSPDGVAWTIQTSYPSQTFWTDLCWSPELQLFCAVGTPNSSGTVSAAYASGFMTSPDGLVWTNRNLQDSLGAFSVCWSPDQHRFFALQGTTGGGKLYISSNGVDWGFRQYSMNDTASTGARMAAGRIIYSSTTREFVAIADNSTPGFFPMYSSQIIGVGAAVYLFEVEAYDPNSQALMTLRYATEGYNDPTAPGYYEGRVLRAPDFARYLLAPGVATVGASQTTAGEIQLANDDGALDTLRAFGLGGQKVTILIGYRNIAYGSFVKLAVAKLEQALFELSVGDAGSSKDSVTLRMRDRLIDLQQPIQTTKYLGTNALPAGLEGVDDIKGKPKPQLWGQVFNVTPLLVNSARLEYQVDSIANNAPTAFAVYDAGDALTQGSDYTSQSDMESNAPSAGDFRVWNDSALGTFFRLGGNPTGTLTADVIMTTTDAAHLARLIARGPAGLIGSINLDDVTLLQQKNGAPVGTYIDQETTMQSALNALLSSVGAACGFDRLDIFRMRRLSLPAAIGDLVTLRDPTRAAPMAIDDLPINAIRFLPTNDPDKGMPTYRVTLNYARNFTVEAANGLAGAVLADPKRVAFLGNETRSVISTASWVQTPNPLAVQKTVDTLLVSVSDAQDECDRVLSLYAGQRDFIEIDTPLTPQAIALIDIGDAIVVALPRYGYDDGRPMLVTGMIYDASRDLLTLQCWGGSLDVLDELLAGQAMDWGDLSDSIVTGWATFGSLASAGIDGRRIDLGSL